MPPEDELNLDGVFDDDPEIPDEEESEETAEPGEGEQKPDEADDRQEAQGTAQDEPEGQGNAEGDEQPSGSSQQAQGQAVPTQPLFTQADLERIIGERLARDRKVQAVRELEMVAGKSLEEIVAEKRSQRLQEIAERYGVDEEEARRLLESEEKAKRLELEYRELEQRQNDLARLITYHAQKMQHMSNPLAKRYEKEVDEFTNHGIYVDFGTGLAYVLGQKLLSGELMRDLQTAVEQRTIANIDKRSRAAPEAGTNVKPAGSTLTPEEKRLAISLGISPKEWAAEKAKLQQQRRR